MANRSNKGAVSVLNKNMVIISSVVLFKKLRGNKKKWFLVKNMEEDNWEFPNTIVRKGESSARAALRMMGEKGGMTVQVLEEAGRAGGATTLKDKTYPLRHIYYLLREKSGAEGEAIGFEESSWFTYANAIRKLSKREQQMLRQAREELKAWEKRQEEKKEKKKK
ncbi:NUDIX domain-containing protein [Candidatus Woesebacteria bacterium]|nr:NUDIX domain-containing protein [Candidatus Woesebacteria bacterium]